MEPTLRSSLLAGIMRAIQAVHPPAVEDDKLLFDNVYPGDDVEIVADNAEKSVSKQFGYNVFTVICPDEKSPKITVELQGLSPQASFEFAKTVQAQMEYNGRTSIPGTHIGSITGGGNINPIGSFSELVAEFMNHSQYTPWRGLSTEPDQTWDGLRAHARKVCAFNSS